MAIVAALRPGSNDLGSSVTPTFLFFLLVTIMISTLSKNEQKIKLGSSKNHDFCPRDIGSCHLVAARRVKLYMVAKYELVL